MSRYDTGHSSDEMAACSGGGGATSVRVPVTVVPYLQRPRYSEQLSRPDARFVAQLMAVEQQYPQTRILQRAKPDVASAAYRSTALQQQPGPAGKRMHRDS